MKGIFTTTEDAIISNNKKSPGRIVQGTTEPVDVQSRLAVLIDADNASAAIIDGLFAEIAKYGVASVKRIYGDWTQPRLTGWKKALLDYSIMPVQQFSYTTGKNATDSTLIIDAMDLLYHIASVASAWFRAIATSPAWRRVFVKKGCQFSGSGRGRRRRLSFRRATSSFTRNCCECPPSLQRLSRWLKKPPPRWTTLSRLSP